MNQKMIYPEGPGQGKRKEQYYYSAMATGICMLILGAMAIGAIAWNYRSAIITFLNF